MAQDTEVLEEVVVTALGMKRQEKALGYAMTELRGDELEVSVVNPVSALQGKLPECRLRIPTVGCLVLQKY